MFTVDEARILLSNARVFYGDLGENESPKYQQTLNLNDTFYWACADCEYVEDNELPRVAELFWRYGWSGILYWVNVEKRNEGKVEFVNVNRHIEFVKNEEAIIKEEPDCCKRAYLKRKYKIG